MSPAFPAPAFPAPTHVAGSMATPPPAPAFAPSVTTARKATESTGRSNSRSTSAGSSHALTPRSGDAAEPAMGSRASYGASHARTDSQRESSVNDFQVYPVPFIIRNTFINTVHDPCASLDGFYEERQVQSCPGSGLEQEDVRLPLGEAAPTQGPFPNPVARATPVPRGTREQTATGWQAVSTPSAPTAAAATTLMPQELGSPAMPTIGSAGHGSGTCKPCAFVFSKGCDNGTECQFCHLCDAGEKRRRQKEKMERRRVRTSWTARSSAESFYRGLANYLR